MLSRPQSWRAFVLAVAFALLVALPVSAARREGRRAAFIVVLKDSVGSAGPVAAEHARRFGADVGYVYAHALKGYAASLSEDQLGALASDARVDFIERDGTVTAVTTQTGATWGIDRIDQRSLPLSGTFTYANTGAGVRAYIIDTGICNGHGTHVSGTVGGATYGVAKAVTLVAVRVLGCSGSGTISGVIAGIDWVTADHAAGQAASANMSLAGSASSALDAAVRNSIADGVSYAVAAGNGNVAGIAQNACKYSPARVTEAMTIGATDETDKKASWSNYGDCVDWFAPGVGISSAWSTGDSATNTISGTSMATPHTTGVAALYLQSNPSASPAAVRDALYTQTTKGIVTSSRTANNHLLYTNS